MYQIAICEDNPKDSANIQNMLDDYEEAMNISLTVKYFSDAESMLGQISLNGYRPDLLLIDISLPGMTGLDAVRRLRTDNFSCKVVFTTKSPDHALEAYNLNASQYLLKPLSRQRFFAVIDEIFSSGRKSIVVKQKKALRRIFCDEILYCETAGKHQVIHTSSEDITVRMTSRMMKRLVPPPPPVFLPP